MKKYVIALDQGTASSRAIIFDKDQNILDISQKEFTQIYPHEGWVEHNPMEIWSSQYGVLQEVLAKSNITQEEIAAIGITNQRETTIVWNKYTGEPVYNAIVWQCRRTAAIVDELKKDKEFAKYVKENTGLLLDAYFSATKIKWILDNVEGAREKAEKGELLFGTVDTWLVWKLTNGKVHVTDYTNASRTMLYNIKELRWDEKIIGKVGIPMTSARHHAEHDPRQQIVDLLPIPARRNPRGTGRAPTRQPPSGQKGEQIHKPVPVDLHGAKTQGDRADVRISQHDQVRSPEDSRRSNVPVRPPDLCTSRTSRITISF